jgi:hypothetical protein
VVRNAARAAVAVVAATALSGCMGGGDGQQVQGSRIARPTQLVQCRDWVKANPRERAGTIDVLREFAGGPTGSPAGTGRTLEDDEAFSLFDRWCEQSYAEGFRLYKLYTRAAAFKSLAQ